MTPAQIAKAVLVNAKGSPVTSALAIVAIALLGAGKYLTEHAVEPWGTAVAGLGAMLVIGLGFAARDPKKKADSDNDDAPNGGALGG
jgi:hypothetical protein